MSASTTFKAPAADYLKGGKLPYTKFLTWLIQGEVRLAYLGFQGRDPYQHWLNLLTWIGSHGHPEEEDKLTHAIAILSIYVHSGNVENWASNISAHDVLSNNSIMSQIETWVTSGQLEWKKGHTHSGDLKKPNSVFNVNALKNTAGNLKALVHVCVQLEKPTVDWLLGQQYAGSIYIDDASFGIHEAKQAKFYKDTLGKQDYHPDWTLLKRKSQLRLVGKDMEYWSAPGQKGPYSTAVLQQWIDSVWTAPVGIVQGGGSGPQTPQPHEFTSDELEKAMKGLQTSSTREAFVKAKYSAANLAAFDKGAAGMQTWMEGVTRSLARGRMQSCKQKMADKVKNWDRTKAIPEAEYTELMVLRGEYGFLMWASENSVVSWHIDSVVNIIDFKGI